MPIKVLHLLKGLSPLEAGKHGSIAAAQLFGVDPVENCAHLGITGNPADVEDAPEIVTFFLTLFIEGQKTRGL